MKRFNVDWRKVGVCNALFLKLEGGRRQGREGGGVGWISKEGERRGGVNWEEEGDREKGINIPYMRNPVTDESLLTSPSGTMTG